jgi:hypothetical protein
VCYGEHPTPKDDGGHGYTYYFDEPLNLGDIVAVPQTWLGRAISESNGPRLATVISTHSDYEGSVSDIIRVVRRAGDHE